MVAQDVVGLQMLFGGLGLQVPQVGGARFVRRLRGADGEERGEAKMRGRKRRVVRRCIVGTMRIRRYVCRLRLWLLREVNFCRS